MFKKLAAFALSATLVGGLAFPSVATNQQAETYNLTLADYVGAAPELAEKAKEHGFDLSKADPAEKIHEQKNNGAKFEQAPGNLVNYQKLEGDVPVLVILAKYADGDEPIGDLEGQVPAKYYEDLIFGTEYNPYELEYFKQYAEHEGIKAPTDKTMQNVYKESSYGAVNLIRNETTEFVWVELPKGASYYLDQEGTYAENGEYVLGNVNGDARTGEFIRDLLQAADDQVDFSAYAVDGVVPNVFVVHEGTGAEWSRDPAQFWSHKWNLLSALYYGKYYETGIPADQYEGISQSAWINKTYAEDMTYDGVIVNDYNIQPAIGGNVAGFNAATGGYDEESVTGPYPAQAGVYAHEFGHAIGLPDFYDTDYTSEGVGNYSMMSGGSWMSYPNASAYSGNSPTNFDPYSKIFLGWLDPIEVTPEDGVQVLTLDPVNRSQDVVKMEVPGSNGSEYFLFENIQQEGFNEGFIRQGENAHGLVAWHVDENILARGGQPNNAENWMNKRFQSNQTGDVKHYGLSVLQADGNYDLEKYVNRGDAGDFFKTGDKITPNSKNVHTGSYYFWKGISSTPADSGIHVTDIKENADGSISAKFYYSTNNKKK
ncbi:M6 family metalloprotease domain-containing protein [Bacillus sp. PS06]|uniref:M6 family metalloprotease domain-containing protein n=1 Tax=Bacillus sp. PS06 TaxID=2764176 RepID=UPI00177B83C8|nr:M6 family metalloprotease domain-containing protein [Bacillus sp. PS06]MBD8069426.1 M6 family metalloprotease domain-containing protein [Bacillus sp. PS06]